MGLPEKDRNIQILIMICFWSILLIVGITALALGITSMVAGTILGFVGESVLSDIFLGISSFLGVVALAIIIVRLVLQSKEPGFIGQEKPKVVVKVVDVKDIPKTREEQLYEQYENKPERYRKRPSLQEELIDY